MIIGYIDSPPDLRSLMLTCRTLHHFVEPLLYRHVRMISRNPSSVVALHTLERRQDLIPKVHTLHLAASPSSASPIPHSHAQDHKRLWALGVFLHWLRARPKRQLEHPSIIVPRILPHLTNLQALHIDLRSYPYDASTRTYSTFLPAISRLKLTTLGLESHPGWVHGLIPILRSQPALRHLSLPLAFSIPCLEQTDLPVLESFEGEAQAAAMLVPGRPIKKVTIAYRLNQSNASLFIPELGKSTAVRLTEEGSTIVGLEHLDIGFTVSEPHQGDAGMLRLISDHMSGLRRLTLRVEVGDKRCPSVKAALAIMPALFEMVRLLPLHIFQLLKLILHML